MRKILIFILWMTSASLLAQEIRLGVHMDPIITWFSPKNKDLNRDGIRPGIDGGLIVETYFHPNYAFATGLSIGILGGNLNYADSVTIKVGDHDEVMLDAGSTVAYNLSYITIPVSLKMKTNEIGYMTYFAQLGFKPQFNTGSRAKSTGKILNKDFVGREINLMNLSYFIGAGMEYGIGGQTAVTAGIFFQKGFMDVLSDNHYKANLNFLTIQLGVMF